MTKRQKNEEILQKLRVFLGTVEISAHEFAQIMQKTRRVLGRRRRRYDPAPDAFPALLQ